jgi:putative ABC transport system permease protein
VRQGVMTSIGQDVRHALRFVVRNPGFATAAMLTIALGVGGTAAVFSVVYGVLLRPLPYPEPDRIVSVAEEHPGGLSAFGGVLFSNLTYAAWEPGARTIEAVGGYSNRPGTLTGLDEPVRLRGTALTPSLVRVLRLAPAEGRLFVEEDAREGAPPVAVLGYRFWRSRFAGDPAAVGRTLSIDGEVHEIVGVAAAGFDFPGPDPVDVYRVYRVPGQAEGSINVMRALARLAPGATVEQAAAEATAAARGVERPMAATLLFGEGGPVEIRVQPVLTSMTARVRPALLLLGAGIVLVLLIACANVTNLLLSRSTARARELAVRAALGAGRGRLVRQLLTESLVLSLLGGVLGAFLGWALTTAVPAMAPDDFPRLDGVYVDWRFLAVALLAATLVGVAAGTVPALRGSTAGAASAMREGDTRVGTGRGGVGRAMLLGGEAALAVMLLVTAVLLARSFSTLVRVDPGYDPGHVLMATLHLTGAAAEAGNGSALVTRILERTRVSGMVAAAGASNMSPLSNVSAISGFSIPGQIGPDGKPVIARALTHRVSPGYAEALGMRLREGRWIQAGDETAGFGTMLVNESFARTYLGDGRPVVGRRFDKLFSQQGVEVAGIVQDVLPGRLDGRPEPQIYLPLQPDAPLGQIMIAVRTSGDPLEFVPTLRAIVREADVSIALDGVEPLGARVADSVSQPRFAASVLGALATLAVLLAAAGLYSVLSYAVSQRRREFGIRAALGADRGRLMALVLRQGLGVTAAGLMVGMAGALAGTRLLEGLLSGVSPLDAVSFVAAPALLATVALAACLVPALRAAAADPAEALRAE